MILDAQCKMVIKFQTAVHILLYQTTRIFHKDNQPCGELLMKSVKGRSGISILRPYKVFPYQSVKEAIKNLISRNGFLENCEHWKTRQHTIPSGMLGDVYEGKVWREFHEEFFQQSQAHYNLCLTINVDWFQPFTHTSKFNVCGALTLNIT